MLKLVLSVLVGIVLFEPCTTQAKTHSLNVRLVQHVKKLEKKLPKGFTIVVEPPFVVIGDDSPDIVKKHAITTIKWTVDRLKQAFFSKDPIHILDIWLFKDAKSYGENALKLFGETPSTPYGYYSRKNKVLVMNIATGSGTLVHEIVHPFMEANFPKCPPWFNEGLGSLYEQSGERDNKIVGYTNWRLAGLQKAIRNGKVPSFKKLMSQDEIQFYEKDPGTNYSQSRYLLYYLQEKSLLLTYYHSFFKNHLKDPTGYKTLIEILNIKDMSVFKNEWEKFVLDLRFPE